MNLQRLLKKFFWGDRQTITSIGETLLSTKGSEVLAKVNGYLKDHTDASVAAACKSLGFKSHQYYNAKSATGAKRLPQTTKAATKTPQRRPTQTVVLNGGTALFVNSDAKTIAMLSAIATGLGA